MEAMEPQCNLLIYYGSPKIRGRMEWLLLGSFWWGRKQVLDRRYPLLVLVLLGAHIQSSFSFGILLFRFTIRSTLF
jgi:hypothetical protein